ncbi:hypothetical protein QS306_08935 [Paraburkholderia bonniea]|uniref:hypothetical protein n=1 Tax=Paraburkholderia bonniea TaxID=2152891 RepID=UPI00129146D8|nr:hypothetical protein [Paraburkholderia bonniea]WJF89249.1 hypothetical protein QS306_08935 [Paraburkholderia bonniea]WJF92565.1 hypothetical protein QS308_08945 [Paraburkholderia bonniea]
MKATHLALWLLGGLTLGLTNPAAASGLNVGINIGVPAPVYVAPPPPAYYQPPPVYVAPVYGGAPVIVIGWHGDRYWDGRRYWSRNDWYRQNGGDRWRGKRNKHDEHGHGNRGRHNGHH